MKDDDRVNRYEVHAFTRDSEGREVVLGWSPDPDGGVVMEFAAKMDAIPDGSFRDPFIVDLWPKELEV